MTAHELAAALDAHAGRNTPGENTAFVRVNVTLLADAAQRLRELEGVRVAAENIDITHRDLCLATAYPRGNEECDCGMEALRAALAMVGGGT